MKSGDFSPGSRIAALVSAALAFAGTCPAEEGRDSWQQPDRVIADMGLREGMRVADVGCGKGYFTMRLAGAVGAGGAVVAVDPDEGALKVVEESCLRKKVSNVEIVRSQGAGTCLADASCDAVLVCDVLHEVSSPAVRGGLLRDIARAMKPGASLHLLDYRKSREVTFDPYEKLIPREDLLQLARDAGLQLDAEFHYLKYQVFLRFRKP